MGGGSSKRGSFVSPSSMSHRPRPKIASAATDGATSPASSERDPIASFDAQRPRARPPRRRAPAAPDSASGRSAATLRASSASATTASGGGGSGGGAERRGGG